MKYLGISEGFHDAAWAVVEDGELKFATHSERYTRIKGDKRLPIGFDIGEDEYSIYYEDIELKKIEGEQNMDFRTRLQLLRQIPMWDITRLTWLLLIILLLSNLM